MRQIAEEEADRITINKKRNEVSSQGSENEAMVDDDDDYNNFVS